MRPEELEALLQLSSFRPFTVHLTDGTTFEVCHPDQVRLTRSALHVLITRDESGNQIARHLRCALIHINRLETLDPLE